ncbi:MAG: PAS domain-containing protein [Clostridiales bacterium]|nr:PAS domain-containing protein [Clostridiales bacterium]
MKIENVIFTPEDAQILESYKTVLAGLSDYLGKSYEIVLHSLEDLDHSVVAICNGERTGRRIGSPITDLALQMVSKIQQNNMQDYITYFNRNRAGEPLKSTTIFIRGARGRVIGLICINFYLDTPLSTLLGDLNESIHQPDNKPVEILAEESADLIGTVLEDVCSEIDEDNTISAVNRNKEIINRLYMRGIFNLKNAVVRVAEGLGISRNTVYMHLRNIEKK